MQALNLYLGLLILVLINIILGSVSALFDHRFDFKRLLRGLAKGAIVTVCFLGTYVVGHLNPDIIAIKVNGIDVDVLTALNIVILTSYYHYAKQVIEKLTHILNENMNIDKKSKPNNEDES